MTWLGGLKTPLPVSQEGIDQGCDGRILRQNDQRTQEKQENKDRGQPGFFRSLMKAQRSMKNSLISSPSLDLELMFQV